MKGSYSQSIVHSGTIPRKKVTVNVTKTLFKRPVLSLKETVGVVTDATSVGAVFFGGVVTALLTRNN